jgi:hypothetical protein
VAQRKKVHSTRNLLNDFMIVKVVAFLLGLVAKFFSRKVGVDSTVSEVKDLDAFFDDDGISG